MNFSNKVWGSVEIGVIDLFKVLMDTIYSFIPWTLVPHWRNWNNQEEYLLIKEPCLHEIWVAQTQYWVPQGYNWLNGSCNVKTD
jgi:hypothetical protein